MKVVTDGVEIIIATPGRLNDLVRYFTSTYFGFGETGSKYVQS